MKSLLTLILLIISVAANGQILDGLYQNTNDSGVNNYFLSVKGEEVTLFGWDVTLISNDSIYFRSTSAFDTLGNLTFNDFEFECKQIAITNDNIDKIKVDENADVSPFSLYLYFDDIKLVDNKIILRATKDMYLSRFDILEFVKVK